MKKIISLFLCLMMLVSFSACVKDDNSDTTPEGAKSSAVELQGDEAEETETAEKNSDTAPDEDSAKSQEEEAEPIINSGEELESMVNEFNETEDPERKEELREELQKILEQVEKAAAEYN